jgi:TolA-binding protein
VVLLVAAPGRADEADDQFAVAAGQYDRRQWKLAIDEFHVFLQKYPNDRRAHQSTFFLGEALLQSRNFEEARRQFQQYASLEPEGKFARPALFRAGEAAYLAGKLDAAKADLERFHAKHAEDTLNAFALLYLGDIAMSRHAPAEAATLFREGLRRFPEGQFQDDYRIGLARSLEEQGKAEEAERLYLTVAAKSASPRADMAQFYLAALQYTAGKYERACESFSAFENRLAKSPWQPNARLGHGQARLKRNQSDEAIKMFEAVATDPQLGVEARYWIGLAQKAKKDWKAAAKTLRALAEANPSHPLTPAIRFHAGDALLAAGDVPAAIQQFDAVLTLPAGKDAVEESGQPWQQQALRGKLQALLQSKDFAAVDRVATECAKRFPGSEINGDVQRLSARSLIERKEFARAATILQPMVASSHHLKADLENRYLLALADDGLKRPQDALAMLLPVVQSADAALKADAQLAQGSMLLTLKRYPQAMIALEAFLAAKPSGDAAVKGMGELAICYARMNQLDKAKRLFAELSGQYARHPLLLPTTEQLAEAAYDANDTAWSRELSARLTTTDASSEYRLKGQLGLAWSLFKTGKLREAAAAFDQVLKAAPPEAVAAEAALARGQILDQLGQSDAVLAMYDLVINKYPKSKQHCDALLAAARLRDKLRQYQASAADYQRLARDYPQFPNLDAVLYEWAWELQESNRVADATQRFKQLHESYPHSPFWADATCRLAQQAFQAKAYDRSTALAEEVLRGDSDPRLREYAAYLLGQVAVARSDWPKAREAFASFVQQFPESTRRSLAGYWIAETFYRQNDFRTAHERFDLLAERSEPKRASWMAMIPLRRAQLLAQENQWDEAHQIAAKIASDFPGFEQQYEVDYVIGRCLANQADFEGARRAYDKVIRSAAGAKTETAAMAQWMVGETFFHQKNYEAALREYLRLEILYAYPTWQAAALLQAGKCHELLGEVNEAGQLYRRIVTAYPKTPFAEQARQKLQNTSAQRTPITHRD